MNGEGRPANNSACEFLDRRYNDLKQRFPRELSGCALPDHCFHDAWAEVRDDWAKNSPADWHKFSEDHRFNFSAKAIRFKALKNYDRCGHCNLKTYCEIQETHKITTVASLYENENLIIAMGLIIAACRKNVLTETEKQVLLLSLKDLDTGEIAVQMDKTEPNTRQIKSRAQRKLKSYVKEREDKKNGEEEREDGN